MIVIGGEADTDLDDLWAFDLKQGKWIRLSFQGIQFKA